MKQHLKYALIVIWFVSLLFAPNAFADVGGICAAGVDHFNHNYTLTGDGAADMVAVALKQVGLTQSQLGYTGSWCAAFINDCAFLAGQQEAIPFVSNASGTTHVCNVLKQQVIAHGGREITGEPQAGDLVFYYDVNLGRDGHVGLMIDSVNSIHGNHWPNNQPSQVWKGKYTGIRTRRAAASFPTR